VESLKPLWLRRPVAGSGQVRVKLSETCQALEHKFSENLIHAGDPTVGRESTKAPIGYRLPSAAGSNIHVPKTWLCAGVLTVALARRPKAEPLSGISAVRLGPGKAVSRCQRRFKAFLARLHFRAHDPLCLGSNSQTPGKVGIWWIGVANAKILRSVTIWRSSWPPGELRGGGRTFRFAVVTQYGSWS
jgi:hypothetical protein